MTLYYFLATYAGEKNVGNTPENRGQCVGLTEVWFDVCGAPHVWGDAKDLYANAGDGYSKGTSWPAPAGAATVLDATWGGGAGHTQLSVDGEGQVFEQNNPTGSTPHLATYTTKPKGWIGWILPNNYKGDLDMATKEQLTELYKLAFPNQEVNDEWVKDFTGKDMSDVLQNLRDDPSRQAYVTELVNDAAAAPGLRTEVKDLTGQYQTLVQGSQATPAPQPPTSRTPAPATLPAASPWVRAGNWGDFFTAIQQFLGIKGGSNV